MSFKRKNPGNQSIRRQLTFYMGLFVVLPLCLALMLLNFYLQKVTTEIRSTMRQICYLKSGIIQIR